jgi:hypothetical protein
MRDDPAVRTTLDIDDDVLLAVKEIAASNGLPAGKVLSGLARKALERPRSQVKVRNGVPLLPPRPPGSPVLTLDLIKQLSEDD